MKKILTPFFSGIYETNEQKLKNHEEIKEYLKKLWEISPHYGKMSFGFTTNFYDDFSSQLQFDEFFNGLCDIILHESNIYLDSQIANIIEHGKVIEKRELEITRMWFNVNTEYGYQGKHHHIENLINGTYYVSVPKNSGSIGFMNPNPFAFYMNQNKLSETLLVSEYEITPSEGDLLLWPGWMTHEVHKNESTENRITISFGLNYKKG